LNTFFIGVGIALAVEGVLYAVFPEQIKRMMRAALERPTASLRTFGLAALAAGLALIWLASV
jgi:uncharacterized protein YjeT (DUF2065 family)